MKQSLTKFVSANRVTIDKAIKKICPDAPHFSDESRKQWILTHKELREWAQNEGARV